MDRADEELISVMEKLSKATKNLLILIMSIRNMAFSLSLTDD